MGSAVIIPSIVSRAGVVAMPDARGTVFGTAGGAVVARGRLPTDPLFYADLTLENIVVGSRYRVTRHDTGDELATGVAASTTVNLTGLAVYANPMLVKITVRKGTTAPKYEPLDTFVNITRGTTAAYISQVPDPIA